MAGRKGRLGGNTAVAVAAFAQVLCTPALAQAPAADEAQAIVQEAHIFPYPIITMDVTRKQLINADAGDGRVGAAVICTFSA